MRTRPYPTDLTDEEWAILEPVLLRALYGRKRKRIAPPRQYSLRAIDIIPKEIPRSARNDN